MKLRRSNVSKGRKKKEIIITIKKKRKRRGPRLSQARGYAARRRISIRLKDI